MHTRTVSPDLRGQLANASRPRAVSDRAESVRLGGGGEPGRHLQRAPIQELQPGVCVCVCVCVCVIF